MESRLLALKMLLDELGISDSIDTIHDRKRVQKAVYLGQISGIDLGYRFGWYVYGPYSTSLASDYYNLSEALESGETSHKGKKFADSLRKKLSQIKPLIKAPSGVDLAEEKWLELLASVHFLRVISKYSKADTQKVFQAQKPNLVSYITHAEQALSKAGYLA